MPIDINCQGCGQRIRVADEHAGKKARCPNCQNINPIPAASAANPAAPSPSYSPAPLSSNYGSGGSPFTTGPISVETSGPAVSAINNPFAPLPPTSPTTAMPSIGSNPFGQSAAPANPFGDIASNNPYQTRSYAAPVQRSWQQPHRGALVLILGLLGFLMCPLIGPAAVFLGHSDLAAMKSGRMDPDGHGLTLAGLIVGWIATGIVILWAAIFFLIVIAAIVKG